MGHTHGHINGETLAFKRAMEIAIGLSRPAVPKKCIAIDLGYQPSDLSHWLSEHSASTLPGHLIPAFCRIVGNDHLMHHLQSRNEKATDDAVA
jgi:hypothetical protein